MTPWREHQRHGGAQVVLDVDHAGQRLDVLADRALLARAPLEPDHAAGPAARADHDDRDMAVLAPCSATAVSSVSSARTRGGSAIMASPTLMRRRRFSVRSPPTKSATKASTGWARMLSGVSYWISRPSRKIAMRVGHLHRLVDVVADEHDGLLQLRLQLHELVLDHLAVDRVDGAERLVHQQHRRIGGERAHHADALLLAARQLLRIALEEDRRARD